MRGYSEVVKGGKVTASFSQAAAPPATEANPLWVLRRGAGGQGQLRRRGAPADVGEEEGILRTER